MRAMFLFALALAACDTDAGVTDVYEITKSCVPSQGYEVVVPTAAGDVTLSPFFGIVDDPGDRVLDVEACDASGACELEPLEVRYSLARGPGYPGVFSVQCGYEAGMSVRLTFARFTPID